MSADDLAQKITETREWPPKWETAWPTIRKWQAFREGTVDDLKELARFDRTAHGDRTYFADPMPAKISTAFADLIFGEDPEFTAAKETDQPRLDNIVQDNGLPSELQVAADISVSEGEVWWRLLVDPLQADVPLVRWHSRASVLATIRGRHVIACAFVSVIATEGEGSRLYRLFEIHGDGLVLNRLYQGTRDSLGTRIRLADRDETSDLSDDWQHGLPMLAGRVVNKLGRRPSLGVSDYHGIEDYLLALNETVTIGQENARMTLKKRVVVPQRFLDQDGNFPAGADVIVATETDADPDRAQQGLAQIEWEFDAAAFIAYKQELEQTIVARVGLVPQMLGMGSATSDGQAVSGTALKLRFLPASLSAAGKARFWDDALPVILELAQRLDSLGVKDGGFGRDWTDASTPPSVERSPTLPEDEAEKATRHVALVAGELESQQTAIEALHTDWDEPRVLEELRRIGAAPADAPPPPA